MSKYNSSGEEIVDARTGFSKDEFGRLQVVNPFVKFDAQHTYNAQPLLWRNSITGAGTITHIPNESAKLLTNGLNMGDKVISQTRHLRYQPGKMTELMITAVLGASTANAVKRFGYFDGEDGLFFEDDGGSFGVVVRSSTTGTPVDTKIDISDFTGPGKDVLDYTKNNIWQIRFQWLGAGEIRWSINIAGKIVFVHEVDNANKNTKPYMKTANLPVRVEIENKSAVLSAPTMEVICTAVVTYGGRRDLANFIFSASNGTTGVTCSTSTPVFSIRPKATFNGVSGKYIQVYPIAISVDVGSLSLIEVYYNCSLTGASFTSANSNSGVEYDVSTTAISGGTVIWSEYVEKSDVFSISEENLITIPLQYDELNSVSDTLTVVCTKIGGGSTTAYAALSWKEAY